MGAPRPEPVELHAHAMENLRYIRRTLERAGSFTAVPGIGGMLMGSTALAGAWMASGLADAGLALLVGVVAAAVKSRRVKMPLLSGPGRKFVAGFAPPI